MPFFPSVPLVRSSRAGGDVTVVATRLWIEVIFYILVGLSLWWCSSQTFLRSPRSGFWRYWSGEWPFRLKQFSRIVLTTAVLASSLLTYSSRMQLRDSSLSLPSCRQFLVVQSVFKCWLESHTTIHSLNSPCLRQAYTHYRLPGAPSRFYSQFFIYYQAAFSYSSICKYLITGQTFSKSATEETSRGAPQRARRTATVAVYSN